MARHSSPEHAGRYLDRLLPADDPHLQTGVKLTRSLLLATAHVRLDDAPAVFTNDADRSNGSQKLVFVRLDPTAPSDTGSLGTVIHHGREARMRQGMGICGRSDVPLRLEVTRPSLMTIAAIDAAALLTREPRALGLAGHTVGGLLGAFLADLESGDEPPSDDAALDRVSLAVSAEVEKLPSGSLGSGDLYRRAQDVLRARAGEASLRVIDIANDLGVAVQDLERTFRQRRTSVLEELMRVRVSAAQAEIANMSGTQLTTEALDQVATKTGFYDSSHLQRCSQKVDAQPPVAA